VTDRTIPRPLLTSGSNRPVHRWEAAVHRRLRSNGDLPTCARAHGIPRMSEHRENFDHFLGAVVANPFEGVGPDTRFVIEQGVFVPNDPPGAYPVHNMAHYDGALLSVHFVGDTWSTMEGSAVMVAPGVALAAAHVIEPLMANVMAAEVSICCTGLTPSGPRHWRVRHVAKANGTDVMILSLDYASPIPSDGRFVHATMTTRLPAIGELVMIAGLRASGASQMRTSRTFHLRTGISSTEQRFGSELARSLSTTLVGEVRWRQDRLSK
jgi:hypothetical protein